MILSKELCLKIRRSILNGDKYVTIRKELDVKEGTWDSWYWEDKMIPDMGQGFRTFVNSAKHERWMRAVDTNVDEFLYMDDTTESGKKDPQLAKIKQKTTEFVAERMGKDEGFTTRTETVAEVTVSELSEDRKEQIRKALLD